MVAPCLRVEGNMSKGMITHGYQWNAWSLGKYKGNCLNTRNSSIPILSLTSIQYNQVKTGTTLGTIKETSEPSAAVWKASNIVELSIIVI